MMGGMKGDFGRSLERLERQIGDGPLVGTVGASGPQAVAIHEFPSRHSPPSWRGKSDLSWTTPGTGPRFLINPLMAGYPQWLRRIADDLYEPGGSVRAMIAVTRDWKTDVRRVIPRDEGPLRQSVVAMVTDNGVQRYRRKGQ